MIVTVTPNPAVDQTEWVEHLEPGSVHRVRTTHLDPAGKGINVSRVVQRLGWPSIAFGFLAGDTGNLIRDALTEEGVQFHFVAIPGQTRINVTVVDAAGQATSFFEPGPSATEGAVAELDRLVRAWLPACRVLVLAGSLPPGAPADLYAELTRAAHQAKVTVFVDAHGAALRDAVTAGPDLVKPNVEEAEGLLGRRLADDAAIVAAARELVDRGAGTAIISMGRRGAVCARGRRAWRVQAPEVERRSTVGSGDAMVAGLAVALARGDDIEAGLILGTAAGAATAMSDGTALGRLEDIERLEPEVRVEPLD